MLQQILFGEFKMPQGKMTSRTHRILNNSKRVYPTYTAPKPRKQRPSPLRDKVVAAVKRWPGERISRYAQLTATPKASITRVMSGLQSDGLVTKTPGARRDGGGRHESTWHPAEGV